MTKNLKLNSPRFAGEAGISNFLFIVFLLLLPTQLGRHFFLPFSYLSGVRIDYLAPTMYVTDILAILIILLNLRDVIRLVNNKFFYLFISLFIVNILLSLNQPIAIYKSIKILEIILLFGALYRAKFNRVGWTWRMAALCLGAVFEFFLVIVQLVNKHSVQGIFYWFGERYITLSMPDIAKASVNGVEILRPYGTFSHPNSLAGFYLLLYFFVLTMKPFDYAQGKPFSNGAILKRLFLFLSSLLIFFSFSKIAIGVFLLLNAVYLLKNSAKKICQICLISRIGILTILSLIFFSASGDSLTIAKRIFLIKDSLVIFLSHPLFGVGFGNYLVAQNTFAIPYPFFFLQPVHNIFLLWLTEGGLFMFLYVLYIVIKTLQKKKLNFQSPLFYILAVIIITGMFDHYWLTLQQNFLLLPVVFALLLPVGNKKAVDRN